MGTTTRYNLYETLGVDTTATPEQIKTAWHKCARRTHPDRPGGSAAEFVKCENAYDVLSNPLKRREYDAHVIRVEEDEAQYQEYADAHGAAYEPTPDPTPQYGQGPVPTTERKRWVTGWFGSAGALLGVYVAASMATMSGLGAHFGFIRADWLAYSLRGFNGTTLVQNFFVALILAPALVWLWHPFARAGKALCSGALVVMAVATGGLLHGSGLSWKVFLGTGALMLAGRAMAKRAQRDGSARAARSASQRAAAAKVARWSWAKFRGAKKATVTK
jgi:hypothetical protein